MPQSAADWIPSSQSMAPQSTPCSTATTTTPETLACTASLTRPSSASLRCRSNGSRSGMLRTIAPPSRSSRNTEKNTNADDMTAPSRLLAIEMVDRPTSRVRSPMCCWIHPRIVGLSSPRCAVIHVAGADRDPVVPLKAPVNECASATPWLTAMPPSTSRGTTQARTATMLVTNALSDTRPVRRTRRW